MSPLAHVLEETATSLVVNFWCQFLCLNVVSLLWLPGSAFCFGGCNEWPVLEQKSQAPRYTQNALGYLSIFPAERRAPASCIQAKALKGLDAVDRDSIGRSDPLSRDLCFPGDHFAANGNSQPLSGGWLIRGTENGAQQGSPLETALSFSAPAQDLKEHGFPCQGQGLVGPRNGELFFCTR